MSERDNILFETTSAEEAKRLRQRGWKMVSILNGRDHNGEKQLKFTLQLAVPPEAPASPAALQEMWAGPGLAGGPST